jgi:SAM-dependent methyltransferase
MAEIREQLISIETCPVCGSSAIKPFKPATFEITALKPEDVKITDRAYGKIWNLDKCHDCTHVFANPRPTADFIQSLYGDIDDPEYQDEAEGRQKNFEQIMKTLEKLHPEKGLLLDVGAATGILMNLARDRGWNPEGIEPSAWAVQTGRERYGLEIRVGDFETADIPSNRFTAVTMVDFIEHIPDPVIALTKAREHLLPDGTLCLVTPNLRSLAARIAGRRWWHYRPAHLAYFTRRSLYTLLNRVGLRPVKARRYTWTFSAYYLLTRFAGLKFLWKNPHAASFWRRIPIKLALGDSFEIYAGKK